MPKVSVVIPAYQAGRFIREAVESVLNQTYKDYEIVVVYRDSADNTEEVLASYGNKIQVFRQENRGLANARNMGILGSKGEYVAFLDADDMWLPEKLELQVKLLEEHHEIGLVFSDIWIVAEGYIPVRDLPYVDRRAFQIGEPYRGEVFKRLFLRDFIPGSTAVVRRRCFERVGLFDSRYDQCEDYEMWLRLSKCFRVDYVDKPLAMYRMHASSLVHDLEKHLRALLSVRKKALEENPSLLREFDPETIDRVCHRFHVHLGMLHMWKGDQRRARNNYKQYLHLYPYSPSIYFLFLATFLPSRIISRFRSIAKRLNKTDK